MCRMHVLRIGTHLLCSTPSTTSLSISGNMPVRIAISVSLGALTVPPPCATGRAPLASSDIHWRTTPVPLPFVRPDVSSASELARGSADATGAIVRAEAGRLRWELRAVVITSSSLRLAAWRREPVAGRGSGKTRFVRRTGFVSPRRGAIQLSASLTTLQGV